MTESLQCLAISNPDNAEDNCVTPSQASHIIDTQTFNITIPLDKSMINDPMLHYAIIRIQY